MRGDWPRSKIGIDRLTSDRIKENAIGHQLESHGAHYSFPSGEEGSTTQLPEGGL